MQHVGSGLSDRRSNTVATSPKGQPIISRAEAQSINLQKNTNLIFIEEEHMKLLKVSSMFTVLRRIPLVSIVLMSLLINVNNLPDIV